jgi:hypothetical protein
MSIAIAGNCPMGCGPSLFIGEGGSVACMSGSCPRPSAVTELLADGETEHVVELREKDFTVRHPLRERLDDALMGCPLNNSSEWLIGEPPYARGRYRVVQTVACHPAQPEQVLPTFTWCWLS